MPLFMLALIAAVQGITEFLPVSSSGHLALISLVTDRPYQGRSIDVAAHVGTAIAVAAYLRADLLRMASGLLNFGRHHSNDAYVSLLIIIATLPVVSVGYFVNKIDPAWLLNLKTLAIANLIFAMLLWLADKFGATTRAMGDLTLYQAVLIGLVQIFALIPGASRSGVTMMAARYLGFGRLTAARFSLLLSLPTIAGAGVLKAYDLVHSGDLALGVDALIVSALSCLFAFAAIELMMRWLAHSDFTVFVGYRLALGIVLLVAIQADYL